MSVLLGLLVGLATLQVEPATPPVLPELTVRATLEELRKGELFLDATALEPMLAASLVLLDEGARYSGSFAYLEPIRRQRERGEIVKELTFDQVVTKVYGGSAVATYRYRKTLVERGVRHHSEGWASDVFELRDDGAWILVLRHRDR